MHIDATFYMYCIAAAMGEAMYIAQLKGSMLFWNTHEIVHFMFT